MKKCFFKVYKNIQEYSSMEFKILSLNILSFYKKKMQQRNKIQYKSYYKTFCFDIGVKRSVYNFFSLSR